MTAPNEAVVEMRAGDIAPDLEKVFREQYNGVARMVARVIRDPGRAEEVAVEVFLKWSRTPAAQGVGACGWLYRTAARMAVDELRRQQRRRLFERLPGTSRKPPTPEEIHAGKQEQDQVRAVLARLATRQAELLLLRSEGLDYRELADALGLNPASVGTLLSRAQKAFRKEFVKKYGDA